MPDTTTRCKVANNHAALNPYFGALPLLMISNSVMIVDKLMSLLSCRRNSCQQLVRYTCGRLRIVLCLLYSSSALSTSHIPAPSHYNDGLNV